MAEQQQSASGRDTDAGKGRNGHDEEGASYEQELSRYLQERIKPNLNSGAIPLLARSIAKEIARRERPDEEAAQDKAPESEDEAEDEPSAEGDAPESEGDAEDEPSAEGDESESDEDDDAEDEEKAEEDEEPESKSDADDETSDDGEAPDFEADMHDLQAELGKDWILRFSVQGDDGWLTAEKADGTQRIEAQTASVIIEAVELINERAGR